MLWSEVDTTWLLLWGTVMMLLTSIRSVIAWYYWRDEEREQSLDAWLKRFIVTALLSGFIWGAAGYSFYLPEGGVYQAFLVIFLLGIAAGSMAFLSPHILRLFHAVNVAAYYSHVSGIKCAAPGDGRHDDCVFAGFHGFWAQCKSGISGKYFTAI